MTKYVKKPETIEAFQMTPEAMASNVDWPEWMHKAWNGEANEEGSLWCDDFGGSDQKYWLGTRSGATLVHVNSYLIDYPHGAIGILLPSIFESRYEMTAEERLNKAVNTIMPLMRDSVGKLGVKSRGRI